MKVIVTNWSMLLNQVQVQSMCCMCQIWYNEESLELRVMTDDSIPISDWDSIPGIFG